MAASLGEVAWGEEKGGELRVRRVVAFQRWSRLWVVGTTNGHLTHQLGLARHCHCGNNDIYVRLVSHLMCTFIFILTTDNLVLLLRQVVLIVIHRQQREDRSKPAKPEREHWNIQLNYTKVWRWNTSAIINLSLSVICHDSYPQGPFKPRQRCSLITSY